MEGLIALLQRLNDTFSKESSDCIATLSSVTDLIHMLIKLPDSGPDPGGDMAMDGNAETGSNIFIANTIIHLKDNTSVDVLNAVCASASSYAIKNLICIYFIHIYQGTR